MSADICRFGEFELDRNAYQLRHNRRPLQLERIPLDLLFLLVDRRGELVSRTEIFERIWGKDLFLDTDNAINSAVRKLRSALDDDPDSPKIHRNSPGTRVPIRGRGDPCSTAARTFLRNENLL